MRAVVKNLRRKLEDGAGNPAYVFNEPRVRIPDAQGRGAGRGHGLTLAISRYPSLRSVFWKTCSGGVRHKPKTPAVAAGASWQFHPLPEGLTIRFPKVVATGRGPITVPE